MSTEVAHRTPTTTSEMSLPDKMMYAKALAEASLLPRQYQQNPGNVLLAMELGEALGIPPIQAINDIHVIEGKPSASANLIGAMVRKAGHKLRVSGDDTQATVQIIRADDPDFVFEVTWTIDRARQAGLVGGKKDNWAKYPAAMLKARAITECARAATPDALYGVVYTPEELGEVVDEDGAPVPAPASQRRTPVAAGGGSRIAQARARTNQPATPPPSEPEPQVQGEPGISREQWDTIKDALAGVGVTTQEAIGETLASIAQRPITRWQELTSAEADQIMVMVQQAGTTHEPVQEEILEEEVA